jgi:ABC-type lipoprotein export system ATPase subunit
MLFLDIQKSKKLTLFMVTHDSAIGNMGTMKIRIKDGNLANWES